MELHRGMALATVFTQSGMGSLWLSQLLMKQRGVSSCAAGLVCAQTCDRLAKGRYP